MPDKKLIRELSDVHGRLIGVHQDYEGIRIDLGLEDRNLTVAGAIELVTVLTVAIWRAAGWQAANPDSAEEEITGA